MTQEETQLLLKDLCGRLSYGVKVLADIDKTFDSGCIGIINKIEPYIGDKFPDLKGQYLLYEKGCLTPLVVDEVRPYLRPLSSMTEDESNEYEYLLFRHDIDGWLDFVHSRHLDWRNLIEKHLAIEAPMNMYKIE